MTKVQALKVLMEEARAEKGSNTACQRCVRASRALGLDELEVRAILAWLDYCRGDSGEPYNAGIKRSWL